MTTDSELTNRMSSVLLEDKDMIHCPHCGAPNEKQEKNKENIDIFPTMKCVSCKHEWII